MVSTLPPSINAIGMVLVQNLVNFFIPSGSGQAVVTMPILAPVADLIGQSREVAVIAFQFGDGFSNMFWPTAVATECGIMGIGLNKWYKFITPLFGMIVLLRSQSAAPDAPLLRMELPKEVWAAQPDRTCVTVSVAPEDILLLK